MPLTAAAGLNTRRRRPGENQKRERIKETPSSPTKGKNTKKKGGQREDLFVFILSLSRQTGPNVARFV